MSKMIQSSFVNFCSCFYNLKTIPIANLIGILQNTCLFTDAERCYKEKKKRHEDNKRHPVISYKKESKIVLLSKM